MCGIAGWLGALQDGEKHVTRMAQTLHHRGPDACGVRSWPEDGTVWTVFNGEVYNHHELRRTLEAYGHIFKGHSETEVLSHLYEEEGSAFVNKLRGMFALAIYDLRTRTLVLTRDLFGIKPLLAHI
jgi:asparagine synthase (glutamine-hydrolysing)